MEGRRRHRLSARYVEYARGRCRSKARASSPRGDRDAGACGEPHRPSRCRRRTCCSQAIMSWRGRRWLSGRPAAPWGPIHGIAGQAERPRGVALLAGPGGPGEGPRLATCARSSAIAGSAKPRSSGGSRLATRTASKLSWPRLSTRACRRTCPIRRGRPCRSWRISRTWWSAGLVKTDGPPALDGGVPARRGETGQLHAYRARRLGPVKDLLQEPDDAAGIGAEIVTGPMRDTERTSMRVPWARGFSRTVMSCGEAETGKCGGLRRVRRRPCGRPAWRCFEHLPAELLRRRWPDRISKASLGAPGSRNSGVTRG